MTELTTTPAPPVARKDHTETTLHGVILTDDYAWLRDKENPEVTAYLEAENAYAEAVMAPLAGLREELYQEMLSHIKQTDVSVPLPRRRLVVLHPHRRGPAVRHPLPQARHSSPGPHADAAEEVILDGNQLAEGHAFFSIGATDITDDGRWLAYTTDTTGFRQYTLHIKDLETGETLPGEVERVGSVVWAADNRTLFYTVEDEEQKRQFQLWRHTLGTPHADDVLVYQDDDERFNLGVGPHARRQVPRDGVGQPHHQRVPAFSPPTSPTAQFTLISPARRRARILRRPSQRPVVHPHQRSRPQLPPGHRAGRHAGPRTLDRAAFRIATT